MKDEKIPKKIEAILEKIEKKQKPTEEEQKMVRTFLGTLTTSMINPANHAKELNNPNPMEVDVSLQRPETIEQRVRRIMSVSARLAEAQNAKFETPEEADDFDVQDDFDAMPNSPFEMVDHYAPMQPEQPGAPPADHDDTGTSDGTTSSAGGDGQSSAPSGGEPEPTGEDTGGSQ